MCLFMTATLQVNFLQRSTLWFGMVDFLLLCKRDFTWVQWFMWINLLWVKTILRKHSGEESIKMLKNRSYQWSYQISMVCNAVFLAKSSYIKRNLSIRLRTMVNPSDWFTWFISKCILNSPGGIFIRRVRKTLERISKTTTAKIKVSVDTCWRRLYELFDI